MHTKGKLLESPPSRVPPPDFLLIFIILVECSLAAVPPLGKFKRDPLLEVPPVLFKDKNNKK